MIDGILLKLKLQNYFELVEMMVAGVRANASKLDLGYSQMWIK
jgi:hypothetical protein